MLKKPTTERNEKSSPLILPSDSIRTEILAGLKYVIFTVTLVSATVAFFYFASVLQILLTLWLGVTVGILYMLLPDLSPTQTLSSWGLAIFRKAKRIAVSIGLV
jgi:hypothetical protein